jgi:type IV pilus assembly protein PilA
MTWYTIITGRERELQKNPIPKIWGGTDKHPNPYKMRTAQKFIKEVFVMKTTKKGFTLIELIVVIAIIGVLAAILVPSMLGYVRKSKISSANSTASSIYKAINSALTELDEEGVDIGTLSGVSIAAGGTVSTSTAFDATNNSKLEKKIANFFSDIKKVKGQTAAKIEGGSCVALAVCVDSTYTGTYPSGVVTSENYESFKGACSLALDKAYSIYQK